MIALCETVLYILRQPCNCVSDLVKRKKRMTMGSTCYRNDEGFIGPQKYTRLSTAHVQIIQADVVQVQPKLSDNGNIHICLKRRQRSLWNQERQ